MTLTHVVDVVNNTDQILAHTMAHRMESYTFLHVCRATDTIYIARKELSDASVARFSTMPPPHPM